MQILIIWLGTIVASFSMQFINEFKMFKDLADLGYKINMNNMKKLQEQLNPEARKEALIKLFIPIYNIFYVMKSGMQYISISNTILDQFRVLDLIEEMDDYEKEEYAKKPTGLNALLVPMKREIRLAKAVKFKFEDNEFFFEKKGDDFSNITILKVNGPAAKFSPDEQKFALLLGLYKFIADLEKLRNNNINVEDMLDGMNSKGVIDLKYVVEEKNKVEQKTKLEQLKEEQEFWGELREMLLSQRQDNSDEKKEENDGPNLTHKK